MGIGIAMARGDLLIAVGVALMFFGSSVSQQGTDRFIAGVFISVFGWALVVCGAVRYASWKGYSAWLGMLAYLLLPGLIILACLPNRRKQRLELQAGEAGEHDQPP